MLRFFLFLLVTASVFAEDYSPRDIMVSPGHNSFFEIREKSRKMEFVIWRPKKRLRYKLEIHLNGQKVVDHFIDKDTFSIAVGKYDHDVKWRVQAYGKEDNDLQIANDFNLVTMYHSQEERKIPLEVDRHSLEDRLIVSWEDQSHCRSYDVVYNGKRLKRTKKNGVVLKENSDTSILRIQCTEDTTHFGLVELPRKKIYTHRFHYLFDVTSMKFNQDLKVLGTTQSSNQSYLLQSHGLAWQVFWDKKKRNDVTAILRYGRELNFGDDLSYWSYEARLRFRLWKAWREKVLLEYERTTFRYEFDGDFSASQTVDFLSPGIETYFLTGGQLVRAAFLYRKELGTSSLPLSFKTRVTLPQSRKFSWIAEVDYARFDGELEDSDFNGDTENSLTQFKVGLSYLF